ncbi:hypothetical protein [Actinoallomurus iriomotensis]|uniref:Uncharacterized protein n=1 Tax=Actinoallomurus iriomotensis TaxID=478107 RepID=A0A9W6VXS0_9ACTN|nr:hypothetical protein [Actinoallomurus iriomotensis]GLY82101.1 hypothetical protein Airi02_000330 [Actinoallomurus iriomotensis]
MPASDTSHFHENVEDDRPFAILHDLPGHVPRLRPDQGAGRRPDVVVPGSDPQVLERHPALSQAPAGRIAVIT